MALRLKNGKIFLHVPRTGGNWCRQTLLRVGQVSNPHADLPIDGKVNWPFHSPNPGHANADRCGVDPKLCFAYVRHPLEWYRSNWAFTLSKRGSLEAHIRAGAGNNEIDQTGPCDFEEWVLNCLKAFPDGPISRLYKIYVTGVGKICRHERLRMDLEEVLGIPLPPEQQLGRIKRSQQKWLDACKYPQRLAARVMEVEAWCRTELGYTLSNAKPEIFL